jgi:hypothetical protein
MNTILYSNKRFKKLNVLLVIKYIALFRQKRGGLKVKSIDLSLQFGYNRPCFLCRLKRSSRCKLQERISAFRVKIKSVCFEGGRGLNTKNLVPTT